MLVSSHLSGKNRWVVYNPAANSWRALPAILPTITNFGYDAVWTGSELLAWGPLYSCLYGDCGGEVVGQAGIRLRTGG